MISDESIDQHFYPEDGYSSNCSNSHKPLRSVDSVRESRCGCADKGSDKGDGEGTRERDSVACEGPLFGSRMDGRSVPIPVNEPEQNEDNSEHGTDILKDPVPGPGTEQWKLHHLAEEMPVVVEPIAWMGKRVPQDVGGDSYENGESDHGEMRRRVDRERSGSQMQSLARTFRQAGREWLLCIVVKRPEHSERNRKIEYKDSWQGMAECPVMPKGDEVFEIRGAAAYDQG